MKIDIPCWLDAQGEPLSCTEKIKVMRENLEELNQNMQDCFEDAILMSCDEQQIRTFLYHLVESLENPYKKKNSND